MHKTGELIREATPRVVGRDGTSYRALVIGEQQPDGGWQGRIEFHPLTKGAVLSTGRETSQVSRGALEYWADGLEPIYFDGAFERASTLVSL
jgi:hypothetical protein